MSKRIGRGRRRPHKPRRASRTPGTAALQRASGLENSPDLARAVPHLAPETLHQLIRHRGLDACGEIITSATPAQLTSVFDLDLWRHAHPGHDERFDAERFGEWLELLADADGTVAARIVAAMDQHLVVAGLSRYIRVFDAAAIAPPWSIDGEPIEMDATPHGGHECEVGGYLVRAIRADAWDAIVGLLLTLDADHHDRFHALMCECRRLSNSTPEIDGLDDLLMEPEQLLHDLAVDREHRRSQQGYSTPADARAFLLMARRRQRPAKGEPSVNPLVAAYVRAATDTVASGDDTARDLARHALAPSSTLEPPRALLEGAPAQPSRYARIRTLIEYVRDNDHALYLARSHELAFLANTLVAGCSIQSRSFTPQEASDAAAGVCNLGLEHLQVTLPDTFLMDHDLVSAFELGWAVLHEDVSMFTADQLVFALSNLRCIDADIQEGLDTLRIALTKQREGGTPWRARNALEAIAMLDMPAWVSLLGLLDECPVMPAALTATLDRRTSAVSATEFEFISTSSQLDRVRQFMARFPDILR